MLYCGYIFIVTGDQSETRQYSYYTNNCIGLN